MKAVMLITIKAAAVASAIAALYLIVGFARVLL